MIRFWRKVRQSSTFNEDDVEDTLEFARQEFALSVKNKTGATLRDELTLIEKQTGVKPPQLRDLVDLPESCEHVWTWFMRLHSTRPSGMGICSISYTEMQSFFSLESIQPLPWEIRLLTQLDNIAVEHMIKEQDKQTQSIKNKAKPSK